MKKLLGIFIVLSLVLTVGIVSAVEKATKPGTVTAPPVQSVTLQPIKSCCIAGKYQGSHKDNLPATKTCPNPMSGNFIMEIMQDKGCDSKIWGTITNTKDNSVEKFEGKVIARGKCCYIEGVVQKPAAATGAPGQTTKFQGTLCKKDGKFAGNGTYMQTVGAVPGCSGTWEMKQM